MPGYVDVRLSSLRKMRGMLYLVRKGLASSGSINSAQRLQLYALIDSLQSSLKTIEGLSLDVLSVEVPWVRELRRISGVVSTRIHSARGLMIEDRRRLLGLVSVIKRELDPYLQLDLFGQ